MLQFQRLDACTARVRAFLEVRATRLSVYEARLLIALRHGMSYVKADLWARQGRLTHAEEELLFFLSLGTFALEAFIKCLAQLGRLNDAREKVLLAAFQEGCKTVYQVYWYLHTFGPPLAA